MFVLLSSIISSLFSFIQMLYTKLKNYIKRNDEDQLVNSEILDKFPH